MAPLVGSHVDVAGGPASPLTACARLSVMREQFWFWFGYRPGFGTVARQMLL